MTALVVVVSLAAGIACCEFVARTMRAGSWLPAKLIRARLLLDDFRRATTDDERQAALIRAGTATLTVSLAFLAWIGIVAAIFAGPGAAIGREVPFSPAYLACGSVAAIAWAALRWRRHA
jgi:hypothetical protein